MCCMCTAKAANFPSSTRTLTLIMVSFKPYHKNPFIETRCRAQGEGEVKIMSRLLHPWADVAPGDTHAVIADDSDCLLMAAMAASRHQQHLFVLAEPQQGRGIVFGPDGAARGTHKEGLKPLMGSGPSQGAAAGPAAAAAAGGGAAAARRSAPPSPSSSSSSSSASSSEGGSPASSQWWQQAAAASPGSTYNCFSVDALRELWQRQLPFMSSARSEVSDRTLYESLAAVTWTALFIAWRRRRVARQAICRACSPAAMHAQHPRGGG